MTIFDDTVASNAYTEFGSSERSYIIYHKLLSDVHR